MSSHRGEAPRSQELRPRTAFDRRLRTAEVTVLGIWIIAVALLFMSPNFKRSRLLAEEIARRAACEAVRQYALDRHAPPGSFDDLIQFKYILTVPVDPVSHQKLALPDCMGGPEEYMDPVQTISRLQRPLFIFD